MTDLKLLLESASTRLALRYEFVWKESTDRWDSLRSWAWGPSDFLETSSTAHSL